MEFNDKIKQFSERVVKIKDTALTEESTKMSLIVPLFQILGYDVFNPLEFCPEYTADVGIKKGEKVGETVYYLDRKKIGARDIVTTEKVEKQNYGSALENVLEEYFGI